MEQPPPHVVHFSTVHPLGDARILSKMCTSLANSGFRVTLFGPRGGEPLQVNGVTCRQIKIPVHRLLRATLGQYRMLKAVIACPADIYHFHDPELLLSGMILRLLKRVVIFDSHEHIAKGFAEKAWMPSRFRAVSGKLGRVVEILADRCMSAVIVTTAGMRSAYPVGRTVLVRNFPLRSEFSRPADWSERVDLACYVGFVSESRGSLVLARLAKLIDGRIAVAGRLPIGERVKLDQEGGWSQIDYRGVLNRDGVVSLLSQAKVGLALLQPMRNYEDSIPTKLLEYLAAGIPVVASHFASWRALVAGHNCVVFVDPLDENAIAMEVNALLSDRMRAEEMGALGRKIVMDKFVWENEYLELLSLYSDLLHRLGINFSPQLSSSVTIEHAGYI